MGGIYFETPSITFHFLFLYFRRVRLNYNLILWLMKAILTWVIFDCVKRSNFEMSLL